MNPFEKNDLVELGAAQSNLQMCQEVLKRTSYLVQSRHITAALSSTKDAMRDVSQQVTAHIRG